MVQEYNETEELSHKLEWKKNEGEPFTKWIAITVVGGAVSLALYVLDKPLVLSHPSPARLHGPLVLSHPSPARLHGPLIITTPCQVAWSNRFKPQLNLRDEHLA